MQTLLLTAIGLGLALILAQVSLHVRWHRLVERASRHEVHSAVEIRKLLLAHQRVAKQVRQLALRIPRRAPPARTWDDDELATREMDSGETFLPINFEHDLW